MENVQKHVLKESVELEDKVIGVDTMFRNQRQTRKK